MPKRYYTPGVQDLNLTWTYASGNLQKRQDGIKNKEESFTYDNLNRLTNATVTGLTGQTINYGPSGNITSKTDAGIYTYLPSKPNAVSAVTNPTNVIPALQQDITYTAFLQPEKLTENNDELSYTYGADYSRIKGVLRQNANLMRTRYYTGSGYEKDLVNGGANRDIHYIDSPAGLIAIVVREGGNDTYHYIYTDHLGSILTVTNSSGTVEAEQNFDAWGRRRNTTAWDYTGVTSPPDWLYRGYTGHEHLDPFVLINMNGRIYDPVVGRVLSPDNFVQDGFSTQGFNRYSYGLNNPLKYADPDGNFAFIPFLITTIQVASAIIEGAFISGTVYTLNAAITGQSLGGMGQAMLFGGITGGLSFGIGSLLPINGIAGREFVRAGVHGLSGGVTTWAQGGNFGSGFLTSAVGSLVGSGTNGLPGGVQIGASALLGGVAAELSGGSFLQGAVQAGLVTGLNHVMHQAMQDPPTKKMSDYGDTKVEQLVNPEMWWDAMTREGAFTPTQPTFDAAVPEEGMALMGGGAVRAVKTYSVYAGIDRVTGLVKYIGRTSRSVLVRGKEHARAIGTGKELLDYAAVQGGTNLTKLQAKILEQKLILQYGPKNLLNKINGMQEKFWKANGLK